MAKKKGSIEIGQRAYEEIVRLFESPTTIKLRTGIDRKTIYSWRDGCSPGGYALARLHYAGADVLYILTGKRMEVYHG